MKKMEFSQITPCLWALRFEVLGIILLIIATCLTIITRNSFGIVALFAAGIVLCLFNKFCCYIYPSNQSSCPVCDRPHSHSSAGPLQENEVEEAKQGMDNEGGNQSNRSI